MRVPFVRVCLIASVALACAVLGVQFQRAIGVGRVATWLKLVTPAPARAHLGDNRLPQPSHWQARKAIIELQKPSVPDGAILLLGDSIIESFHPNRLVVGDRSCSLVNAGFGGIGVRDLLDHAEEVTAIMKPSFVLLAVGINDARPDVDIKTWTRDYTRLVETLIDRGATPALFTVLPTEAGLELGSGYPADRIARLNDAIKAIGVALDLPVVDNSAEVTGPDGLAKSGTTVDGIHPSAQILRAFEKRWFPLAVERLQQLIGKTCAPIPQPTNTQ